MRRKSWQLCVPKLIPLDSIGRYQIIDGNFDETAFLGKGFIVVLGQSSNNKPVVIKFLNPLFFDYPVFSIALSNSRKILKRCRGQGTPRLIDEGLFAIEVDAQRQKLPYIVTEYFPARKWPSRGSLSKKVQIALLKKLVSGYCRIQNSGFVHFDIRPENILLSRNSRKPDVKIIDLTSSLYLGNKKYLKYQSHGGFQPNLAPPEIIMRGRITKSSDVYTFARTIDALEAFTIVKTDNRVKQLIDECTQIKSTDRPKSFDVVRRQLNKALK